MNHFNLPLNLEGEALLPHTHRTPHGIYPHYRISQRKLTSHYDSPIALAIPPIAMAARIIYFSRRSLRPFAIPSALPIDRAHATSLGMTNIGPTQADLVEFNSFKVPQYPKETKWDWREDLTPVQLEVEDKGIWCAELMAASARYDQDWARLRGCGNPWSKKAPKEPRFLPGSICGLWQGRYIVRTLPSSVSNRPSDDFDFRCRRLTNIST